MNNIALVDLGKDSSFASRSYKKEYTSIRCSPLKLDRPPHYRKAPAKISMIQKNAQEISLNDNA
jgi:hypothetical protein